MKYTEEIQKRGKIRYKEACLHCRKNNSARKMRAGHEGHEFETCGGRAIAMKHKGGKVFVTNDGMTCTTKTGHFLTGGLLTGVAGGKDIAQVWARTGRGRLCIEANAGARCGDAVSAMVFMPGTNIL